MRDAVDSRWSEFTAGQNLTPEEQTDAARRLLDRVWDGTIDSERIRGLGEYCDALANSLCQRIYFESQLEYAEWSVSTLRGGLVQLVHSATTALRSSAGLYRFALETDFGTRVDEDGKLYSTPASQMLGLVPRLTVYERTDVRRLFSTLSDRSRLEVLTLEVGHLVNPAEYERYFHEVAHALFFAWDDQDGAILPRPTAGAKDMHDGEPGRLSDVVFRARMRDAGDPPKPDDHFSEPRTGEHLDGSRSVAPNDRLFDQLTPKEWAGVREEIFAIGLTQVFIYEADWRTGQAARSASFASSPRSGSVSVEQAHFELFKHLFCGYAACYPLLSDDLKREAPDGGHPARDALDPDFGEARPFGLETMLRDILPKFVKFCEQVAGMHCRFETFIEWLQRVSADVPRNERFGERDDRYSNYLADSRHEFWEIAVRMQAWLCAAREVWWRIAKLRKAYLDWFWPGFQGEHISDLVNVVKHHLDTGQASVDALMHDFQQQYPAETDPRPRQPLDELMLICVVIRVLVKDRIAIPEEPDGALSAQYSRPTLAACLVPRTRNDRQHYPVPEYISATDIFGDAPWPERPTQSGETPTHETVASAMIDRRFSRIYAVDGADRDRLIRQEVAGLRLLWELSCRQRSRRFTRLFEDDSPLDFPELTGDCLDACVTL